MSVARPAPRVSLGVGSTRMRWAPGGDIMRLGRYPCWAAGWCQCCPLQIPIASALALAPPGRAVRSECRLHPQQQRSSMLVAVQPPCVFPILWFHLQHAAAAGCAAAHLIADAYTGSALVQHCSRCRVGYRWCGCLHIRKSAYNCRAGDAACFAVRQYVSRDGISGCMAVGKKEVYKHSAPSSGMPVSARSAAIMGEKKEGGVPWHRWCASHVMAGLGRNKVEHESKAESRRKGRARKEHARDSICVHLTDTSGTPGGSPSQWVRRTAGPLALTAGR